MGRTWSKNQRHDKKFKEDAIKFKSNRKKRLIQDDESNSTDRRKKDQDS